MQRQVYDRNRHSMSLEIALTWVLNLWRLSPSNSNPEPILRAGVVLHEFDTGFFHEDRKYGERRESPVILLLGTNPVVFPDILR